MRFSIRFLTEVMVVVAAVMISLFAVPVDISLFLLPTLSISSTTFCICAAIYGQETMRAFFIGCLPLQLLFVWAMCISPTFEFGEASLWTESMAEMARSFSIDERFRLVMLFVASFFPTAINGLMAVYVYHRMQNLTPKTETRG